MIVRRRAWIGDGSDRNPFRPAITALGSFSWVHRPNEGDVIYIYREETAIKEIIRTHPVWKDEIVEDNERIAGNQR